MKKNSERLRKTPRDGSRTGKDGVRAARAGMEVVEGTRRNSEGLGEVGGGGWGE